MEDDSRIVELRRMGARIGRDVFLGPSVYVEPDFASLLEIEDGAVLARGVSVVLHDSALNNVAGEPVRFGRVVFRRNCYIGANTTVLCGVEIGARAIVGACSLVTRSIPPEAVAYGHPARVHGRMQDMIEKHRELRKNNPRSHYLDLTPWRDRRNARDAAAAADAIASFLNSLAAGDGHGHG